MQGALDKQSLLLGVVWRELRSNVLSSESQGWRTGRCAWMHLHHDFRPLAQRLSGFEPNPTNKPGFSCQLSCSPSPAVRFRTGDPVTRCKYIPVSSASPSLARKVTVPPVPENEVYVCGHFRCFKLLHSHRITPTPLEAPRL